MKIIVSMTWISWCDLFIWPFCPSLYSLPHTIAHSFAYSFDCPHKLRHTHTLTTTHTTNDTICFPKNAHFLNVGKYVVVFHPSLKQMFTILTLPYYSIESDRQIEIATQICSSIRLKIVDISMSLSSIVVVIVTKCYPNWSHFLATALLSFFLVVIVTDVWVLFFDQKFLLLHQDKLQLSMSILFVSVVIWIKCAAIETMAFDKLHSSGIINNECILSNEGFGKSLKYNYLVCFTANQ